MTPATGRKLTDACNGVTVTFNCPAFQTPGDLKVYLLDAAGDPNSAGTLLAEAADYVIGGGASELGLATITTTVAYPAGKYLRRWRSTSRKQDVQIVANEGVPAATQEAALDRLSLIDEEQDDDFARSISTSPGEAGQVLPSRGDLIGKFLGGDAGGNLVPLSGSGADGALRADLAAAGGSALVGFKLPRAGTVSRPAQAKHGDVLHMRDFGIACDGTDETAKLQQLFGVLAPGDVVIAPNGGARISTKLTLGNGSAAARSTLNSVTFICPPGAHETAFINPFSGLPKSGFWLEWYGAAGGTMMEWAGPIHGINVVGALQLDGRDIAGKGLQAYSFSHCKVDQLAAYNCTVENIRFDTRDAVTVAGDANGITSADNRIGVISSFTANNPSAIALVIDGYEAVGGQDVTGSEFGVLRLGFNGNRGKGLWLGYTDFVEIDQLIGIIYGGLVGEGDADHSLRPTPFYLDGSSLPFNAPTTTLIRWFSTTAGTVQGGTNGQVYIENYSLDDGGAMPLGIGGLNVRRFHSADPLLNGLTLGSYQRPCASTISDLDGFYGKDATGAHQLSLTRRGNAAHVAARANVEFEAGAIGGPTGAKHLEVGPTGPISTFLVNAANDAAAAAGGVPVGGFHRNGGAVQVRLV